MERRLARDRRRRWPVVASIVALAALVVGGAVLALGGDGSGDGSSQIGDPFPDETSTGVPAGTELTPSGSLLIEREGTIVDGLDISGCITVQASHVLIRNTRIRGRGECLGGYQIATGYDFWDIVVEDVEIDGLGHADGAGICCSGFTVTRANIHDVGVGIHWNENVVVEDSFIHALVAENESHNDGIMTNGDGGNAVFRHNRIENPLTQTSAFAIFADFGGVTDVLVENNLFAGGGWTVYAGGGGEAPSRLRFIGNRFSRRLFPDGGEFGPVTGASVDIEWVDNVWHETGEPVELPLDGP
jgi:hypothetical protein